MAALIKSADDLPAVLARFYRLGASRNGWLAYTALPGEAGADRARLIDAGLDVDTLEAAGQFVIAEIDLELDPESWIAPWIDRLAEAADSGFDAMWFARFPIAPDEPAVTAVRPFEAAWMDQFHDQRVVTLCPYIVDGMTEPSIRQQIRALGEVHDEVHEVTAGQLQSVHEQAGD